MTKNGNAAPRGIAAVRAAIDMAEPVPTLFDDPEPGQAWNGDLPGQWRPAALGLPKDWPVVPLGVDGSVNWFLDPIGQLYAYTKPYGQAETLELHRGRHKLLYWAWPKWSKSKIVVDGDGDHHFEVEGWRNEKAREALIAAATAKGPWNAADRLRGRGIWRAPDGGLVIHCGHKVILPRLHERHQAQPPGELDGYVYSARPAVPRPAPGPISGQQVLKLLWPLLRGWNWSRGRVDAHLMLGWIGAAFLGAALDQRPVIYVAGDKGVGKSSLQDLIKGLFGAWLMSTVDTTAAGIYQQLGHDCLPVAIDEFEGKADTRKAKAVLELARAAYSGGSIDRGGDRHQGKKFELRSAFFFSSINTPPLEAQDLSRMGILRLHKLPHGAKWEPPSRGTLEIIGQQILRRMIDQWDRYPATLKAFRNELQCGGMDARGCDTFGTLLACADLIEFDGWEEGRAEERLRAPNDDGDMRPWRELLTMATMIEFEDATENWRACLDHMLAVPVEAWRNGTKRTVGQMLEAIYDEEDGPGDVVAIRRELAAAGLGFVRRARRDDWLAVPNQDPALRKLFEGSKWQGELGASVWAGALRQAPRGEVYEVGQARINGRKAKVTLIRLGALYGPHGIMTDDEPHDSAASGPPPNPDPMFT